MSDRERELALRRGALQVRCAVQRGQLVEVSDDLQHQLRFIDRGIEVARRVTAAPMLIVIGLAALTFIGPRGMVRWISRALLVATAVKRLAGSDQRAS